MATTTTLTSLSSSKTEKKSLCSICELQPYDLICTCGDKFDFICIQQHVEYIGLELQDQYEQVSKKLARINDLKATKTSDIDGNRTAIDHWKRKRIQDINDIAEKATNDAEQRENFFQDISSFQETYDQVSADLHRVVHDNLNTLITLNQQLQNKIEDSQNLSASLIIDEKNLDASLQSKLNPSTSNTSETTVNGPFLSYSSISKTNATTVNGHSFPYSSSPNNNNEEPTTNEFEPITSSSTSQYIEEPRGRRDTEPTVNDLINTTKTNDSTNATKTNDITNTPKTNDSINDDKQEEFDAGQTRHIQRNNPIIISTNNDEFAATVCCHDNQLLYNDYDRKTREFRLFFIPDINNPTVKETIPWNQLDATNNGDDDEWIQDIIYSEKLSSYLLLNRVRLVQLNEDSRDRNELVPFHTFTDRTMKRIGCSDKYIYVTCSHGKTPYNGDEIILMDYQKEEQLRKTFRDIIPSRINRGAGALVGEISDLAVGANEQVIIGYRLERRHEVGVCLFNVTNDGREWSCVKQLLLNDCWHSDLSYTPRLDWSDKLKLFTLIEYMTGHLIMIDRHGQVEGECRFMQVGNGNDSPINLAVSTNDWLCVRYQSSITIHKLTS